MSQTRLFGLEIGSWETCSGPSLFQPQAHLFWNAISQNCTVNGKIQAPEPPALGLDSFRISLRLTLNCTWMWVVSADGGISVPCSPCDQCLGADGCLFLHQLTLESSWKAWMQVKWGGLELARQGDSAIETVTNWLCSLERIAGNKFLFFFKMFY
jgi:hypothetical protein